MPTKPIFIDARVDGLKSQIENMLPTPGYCIFIDVVGSTEMKQKTLPNWIALIHNSFALSGAFMDRFRPLKAIGDELMYFIEEADLEGLGETPLTIFNKLYQIISDLRDDNPPTKIVAAYCSSVYPLTFIQGTPDYYGIGIDRSARLWSIKPAPIERELVMDADMYSKVKLEYDKIGNKGQFQSFTQLTGPFEFSAKGIPHPIEYYRTDSANT